MVPRRNGWWDATWNNLGGCLPVDPACRDCLAAFIAGGQQTAHGIELHSNVTKQMKDGHHVFNGRSNVLAAGHPTWVWPLRYPGAKHPLLGPGMPSLIAINLMSDQFYEGHPIAAVDRTVATIALSNHIGQFLTRRSHRMRDYFLSQSSSTLQAWLPKMWLGASAATQRELDLRAPDLIDLADAGFTVFLSLAPLLERVTLPPDFLALGNQAWVIVAGQEKVRTERLRDTHPDWMKWVCDQCAPAGVPVFVKHPKGGRGAIRPDLAAFRQFPRVDQITIKQRGTAVSEI
jgi:protein gp37